MNKNPLLLLLTLIFLTFCIRIFQLDTVALRGDEAYTILHWTATPFSDKWLTIIRAEPAPLGAFTLYWGWDQLVGNSAFAMRYLSVLADVLGMAGCAALTKYLLKRWDAAFLAGLMWAFHANLLWHAQDARVYSLVNTITLYTFISLFYAVKNPVSFKRWIPYVILQTLNLYIYFFAPFWMASQLLFILLTQRNALKPLVKSWLIIGVLWSPVLLQINQLLFKTQFQGHAPNADVTLLFSQFLPAFVFGGQYWHVLIGVIIASMLGYGLWKLSKTDPRTALLLLCWIVIPAVSVTIVSTVSNFFLTRYIMPVIPAFIILLTGIIMQLNVRRLIVAVASMLMVIFVAQTYGYFFIVPPKTEDWVGLTRYLDERTANLPHTVIIADVPDPALEYYYRGSADISFIPHNESLEDYFAYLSTHYQVFYLLSGENTAPAYHYLQQNNQHISGDSWAGVIHFRQWVVEPSEIRIPLDIALGDIATLKGYSLVGDSSLIFYWLANNQTLDDYSVLVHLQHENGEVISLDHAPASAIISTRTWTPSITYRDPVAFPVDIPAGIYQLYISLYPSGKPEEAVSERFLIGHLMVSDNQANVFNRLSLTSEGMP